MKHLTILAAAALLAVNINTQAAVTLPATPVCFTSSQEYPAGSFSYLDLTLSGVPAGFSVGNSTYPGWCVEAFNFEFAVGQTYCGATLRSTTSALPAHLAGIPWGVVNWILNNKQGTPQDVQNAIWHFTDSWPVTVGENTGAYQNLLTAAASQGGFVPGPGDVVAAVLDLGDADTSQIVIIEVPNPTEGPGTGTPGYWKNHPGAWPVSSIKLGAITYTKAQALAIMRKPTSNDKTYNLAEHLIAAKLNVLAGNDASCIAGCIAKADAFLTTYPIGSGVRANSFAWQTKGSRLLTKLVAYNEGRLCAPSRD